MENVQKTRRLFASAYGCKASRSFLIWSLSAAMSISVAPMMAEVSADVRNFGTQLVTQVKRVTGTIIDETGEPMIEYQSWFRELLQGRLRIWMGSLYWRFPQMLHWLFRISDIRLRT